MSVKLDYSSCTNHQNYLLYQQAYSVIGVLILSTFQSSLWFICREIGAGEEEVNIALCSLRDRGFINYFGMQRFGTSVIPTHEIGRSVSTLGPPLVHLWSTSGPF